MASGAEYLEGLYDRIGQWATQNQGMVEVTTFLQQEIDRWEVQTKGPGVQIPLSLDLQRGSVFTRDGLVFGLSLGEGLRSCYARGIRSTRLQFGGFGVSLDELKLDLTPEYLAMMVNKHDYGLWMYGEVYEEAGRVGVDCWADSHVFGGEGIREALTQDEILSEKGQIAILRMVNRTVERGI